MKKIENELSDAEITLMLAMHIKNPGSIAIDLNEAERLLPALKKEYTASFLKTIIGEYR